jgi:hypothetical protein
MSRLFHRLARPLATPETPEAFLGGLRLVAVDGRVFDLPDTQENARVFGYPGRVVGTPERPSPKRVWCFWWRRGPISSAMP